MKLYVETMDAVVVDVDADGRVRLEDEDWSQPTLQERRAIIHAAQEELAALGELLEILQAIGDPPGACPERASAGRATATPRFSR